MVSKLFLQLLGNVDFSLAMNIEHPPIGSDVKRLEVRFCKRRAKYMVTSISSYTWVYNRIYLTVITSTQATKGISRVFSHSRY